MKKFLITAVLILAVLTSLTAGTLAAYTKTLAPFQVTGVAKTFDFVADSTMSANTEIKIAPGETKQYSVILRQSTEVPVSYTATLDFLSGDPAFYQRLGTPTVSYSVDNVDKGTLSLAGNKITIPEVDAGNHKVVLTFSCSWTSGNGALDTAAQGKSANMNVTIKGDQII